MAKAELPSPETLRKLLDYNPETGVLTWKARDPRFFANGAQGRMRNASKWNSRFSGRPALTADVGKGYLVGSILGRSVRAHRAAWAIAYGEWPKHDVDHIDGDRTNNRLANLRDVTHATNCKNKNRSKRNSSGYTGVHWETDRQLWSAYIGTANGPERLGSFKCKDDAIAARQEAEIEHGYDVGHGKRSPWAKAE